MLRAAPCLSGALQHKLQQPSRNLSIHEYQAMHILQEHGVAVPKYEVAETPEQVKKIALNFGEIVCLITKDHFAMLQNEVWNERIIVGIIECYRFCNDCRAWQKTCKLF